MLENCKQMSNNHPFAITAFLLIWHLFFQLTSYMKLRNYTAEGWNIDTWQHIESAWEWGTTDAHKLTKRGCTCYSFHENTIHWLTICIRFACLFCKSQKWVAVATATCYLACGWEMSLGVPFKKQIQHALCCSSHPRGTNLLTGCLFFQSFKKLDCFCLLHLTVTHIYWKGKKKKNLSKCYLPVWLEHERDAASTIPTFINTAPIAILTPATHLLNLRTPLPTRVYGSIPNVPAKASLFSKVRNMNK